MGVICSTYDYMKVFPTGYHSQDTDELMYCQNSEVLIYLQIHNPYK